jgi:aminoglycoside phosphotransferase (APT) family kinase protein
MEYIEGEQLWPLLSKATETERAQLLTRFCELFVQLHALDWQPFNDDPGLTAPYHFIDQWLARSRAYLQHFPEIQEGTEPALAWIAARCDAVACERPSPVHLDYHPANVLLRPDGSAIVIDWTGFAVSDYRFDLAWTLILANAYEDAAVRDQILQTYERIAGRDVEQLACFEVIASLRRLIGISISLQSGPEQMGMRPEATSIMQQQMPAHARVYATYMGHTNIPLPFFEKHLLAL